jgi:ATP-dependent exoDNAse (exonuclease V) alpha subunit
MIALSPDQEDALEYIFARLLRGERISMLAGAAGCGKTTIVDFLIRRLKEVGIPVIQSAITGKACLQMMRKSGRPAVTLCRIAYANAFEGIDGELYFAKREDDSLNASGLAVAGDLPAEQVSEFYELMSRLSSGGQKIVLIIDEASMVDHIIFGDLMAAITDDILILGVGDHCQLFPVGGRAAFPLWDAQAKLETVHRQAAGSLLLRCFTQVREEKRHLTAMMLRDHGLKVREWSDMALCEHLAEVHKSGQDFMCLTALNKPRIWINGMTRQIIGYPKMAAGPQVGERVIVLGNNYAVPCFNGMTGVVTKTETKRRHGLAGHLQWIYVQFDGEPRPSGLYVHVETWAQKMSDGVQAGAVGKVTKGIRDALKLSRAGNQCKKLVSLAPALAMTYHKAQGSQSPRGVVRMDAHWMKKNRWRGDYTAGTRFEDNNPGTAPDVAFVPVR